MISQPTVIELTEHGQARYFDRDRIPAAAAQMLTKSYDDQVYVEYPSPKTDERRVLAARGWVGYIPVSRDFEVSLQPKVKLANLFRMLERAYRLQSFKFLQGLTTCSALAEFYQALANVLARRVPDRTRKGV